MTDIKDLLELAVDDIRPPVPHEVQADVTRGRRALRWRRGLQSVFAAGAVAAIVAVVPQVAQIADRTGSAPAAPPTATSTSAPTERTTTDVYHAFVAALDRNGVAVKGRVLPMRGGVISQGRFLLAPQNQPNARENQTSAEVEGGTVSLTVIRLVQPINTDNLCAQYAEELGNKCAQDVLPDGAILLTTQYGSVRITTVLDGKSVVEVTAVADVTTPQMVDPPVSEAVQREIVTDPALRW